MPFYIFAWIASFFYGLEVIFGKLTSKYAIANPWLFNFAWSLFVVLFTLPLALTNHVGVPGNWGNLVVASVLYGLSGILYVLMLSLLDVSVMSPLFNLRTALSVLLSAFLLGEILAPWQYFLTGIIFVAGVFVSMDEKLTLKSFFSWPIAVAVLEMIDLSFYGIFVKKTMAEVDYWTATLWIALLAQVMLLVTVPLFWKDVKKVTVKGYFGAGLMALAGGIGVLLSNRAYAANVSITSVIISLPISMIIAFILSFIAPSLLEKHSLRVYAIRFSAAAVMIGAALKLSS